MEEDMQRYLVGAIIGAAALGMSTLSAEAHTAFARVSATGIVLVRSLQVSSVANTGPGQYRVNFNNLNANRCSISISSLNTVGFYQITSPTSVSVVLRRNQDHVLVNDEFSIGVQCG
jgi:hypothetical protein